MQLLLLLNALESLEVLHPVQALGKSPEQGFNNLQRLTVFSVRIELGAAVATPRIVSFPFTCRHVIPDSSF